MPKFTTENASEMGRRGFDATAMQWLVDSDVPLDQGRRDFTEWRYAVLTMMSDPFPENGAFRKAYEYRPPETAPAWAKNKWRRTYDLKKTMMGLRFEEANGSLEGAELRRLASAARLTEHYTSPGGLHIFWLTQGPVAFRQEPIRIVQFIRLAQQFGQSTMRGEHISMLNSVVLRSELDKYHSRQPVDWRLFYHYDILLRPGYDSRYIFMSEWLHQYGFPIEDVIALPSRRSIDEQIRGSYEHA